MSAIARTEDEQQRDTFLEEAIAQGLSVTEIKAKVKEAKVNSATEPPPKEVLVGRMGELTKRLKKTKA